MIIPSPHAAAGAALLIVCALAVFGCARGPAADISLDPTTRYQTISGWEVTAGAPEPAERRAFHDDLDAVFDAAVNQVGINRVRLEIRSGVENNSRGYERLMAGNLDPQAWRSLRYATVNDNDDPQVINWAGFDFIDFDANIEQAILPLKRRLAARGEKLYVNVNYVAFADQIKNGAYIHDNPEEYAEFVLATYLHMQKKYGFVPDAWEVILEPDNVKQWHDGATLGRAMVATARRLRAQGFTPHFIAPSVTDMGNTLRYMDQLEQVPGATQDLVEISYHRYWNGSRRNALLIAERARRLGVRTGMLEWWFGKGTYEVLHEDLRDAQVSAWQGRTLWTLFDLRQGPTGRPVLTPKRDVQTNSQYFRYVRAGAVRIAAKSSDPAVDPLAFINSRGSYVVVMKVDGARKVAVHDLPAGEYVVSYTRRSGSASPPRRVQVSTGTPLRTTMPGAGVLTVARL